MSFRVLLSLSVVFCLLAHAAFAQQPAAAASPSPQVYIELVLLRVTGTRAELDEIRNGLGKLVLKDWQQLDAFVEVPRRRGQITVLAEPHVVALIGKPTAYLSGGWHDGETFGTRVNVLPTRMADGRIMLKLDISKSELNTSGKVQTKGAVQTSVMLEDGHGFAIGGSCVRHEVREVRTGPALLKDISLLQDIFCKRQTYGVEVETICLGHVEPWPKK